MPFARFVVQHQNELSFPFKRYQIQPVWRADRPQHGRFPEFTQCDADAIGSDSLLLELEFIQMIDAIFGDLVSGCTPCVSITEKCLRPLLNWLVPVAKRHTFFTTLDKLDKVGWEEVKRLLLEADFDIQILDKINAALEGKSNIDQLDVLGQLLGTSDSDHDPIQDLSFFVFQFGTAQLDNGCFDWTLARGLDYYTGTIFEISAPEQVTVGSIGAGGRYDDLTGVFGMKDMSGIGISFGLDRIELVLSELRTFPPTLYTSIDVMVVNFSMDMITSLIPYIQRIAETGQADFCVSFCSQTEKAVGLGQSTSNLLCVIMGEEEWKDQSWHAKRP